MSIWQDIFNDSESEFDFYKAVQFAFAGLILVCILLYVAARHPGFADLPLLWRLLLGQLPFVLGGTGGALLGLRHDLRRHGWRKVLNLPAALPCHKKTFLFELLKWTPVLLLASFLLNYISINLLTALGVKQLPKQFLQFVGFEAGCAFWLIAFGMAVVVAPICEEILFRRILYQGVRSLGLPGAELITALIFSLAHGLPQAFPTYIVISLLLQKACRKGSLWLAIALHASYNCLAFSIVMIIKALPENLF